MPTFTNVGIWPIPPPQPRIRLQRHQPQIRYLQPLPLPELLQQALRGCLADRRKALEETTHRFTPPHLLGICMSRFQRTRVEGVEDITYLRFAFAGELGDVVPGRTLDTGILRTVWRPR